MSYWAYSRSTAIDGVFFVFVSVVIIVITSGPASREAVEDEAGDSGLGFAEEVDAALDGFAGRLA